MKGLLNRIAITVLIGLGSLSAVQAAGGFSVTVSKGNVVLIKFDDIQSEIAYIKLVDASGEQLWSEIVKGTTTFHKQFNLAQLSDGIYEIIMTDGDLIHTQEVRKEINKVYVIKTSTVTILRPVATLKSKKLTVTYPAGISKIERITFLASNGDLFFSDKLDYTDDFKKSYNLKKLGTGDYTVVLKTDQDTFYKDVSIK